jgi:hypothetical protein
VAYRLHVGLSVSSFHRKKGLSHAIFCPRQPVMPTLSLSRLYRDPSSLMQFSVAEIRIAIQYEDEFNRGSSKAV